ncbi:ATP-dependent RNA helicase vasa isoform X2 [Cryptotermes secundus]|uniref:ATP-dependent RNA helicase vasa isoform X2 n=1 Tax=Cryptotermes secundus TaxID=105785 RepID=UPI001454BD94|nr:ATP-dependent RNA helicase vasa isoform X2 [Cryptotermes secundus]
MTSEWHDGESQTVIKSAEGFRRQVGRGLGKTARNVSVSDGYMYVPDVGKDDDIPEFSGISQWSSDISGRVGGHSRGGRGRHDGTSENRDGPPKLRDHYIPPEPADDEETIFGSGISSGINFDKYNNIKVKVTGENVPQPIDSFVYAGLCPFVLNNIKKSGYLKPTPVQKYALPIIMSGRDLMACAQTGSGKTAAFLLPVIDALLSDPRDLIISGHHCEPHVVIMSPTRELALQIYSEARKFAYGSTVKTVVVYGGIPAYHQAQQIMRGCHILVATPGRLIDFLSKGRITLSSVRFMVLDEGDRMLDMGFLRSIEEIMEHPTMVPKEERQTCMFSATFPEDIQHLARKFLHNYLFLGVGIVGGACSDVEQHVHMVTKFQKRPKLLELLFQDDGEKILVFVEMKRTADFIASYLCDNNVPTTSIHGDRLQRERETALCDFKTGHMRVLVATPVAARGLDIKNVSHVVNYDLPKSIDEYVHRIGRTGRVGNRGKATSFYDPEVDGALARDLLKILQQVLPSA